MIQFDHEIRSIAGHAGKLLPKNSAAYREAVLRFKKPIDYLRCLEFPMVFSHLSLRPQTSVLDIASPQWFSLCLAKRFPETVFYHVNILQEEIDAIEPIARASGIRNIRYGVEDARTLKFPDGFFESAFSISAVEHVAPDFGGDVAVLKEVRRVLKPQGILALSVPFRDRREVVYDNIHPVWERPAQANNFYMRIYDSGQIRELAQAAGFALDKESLMSERVGFFSLEYWEIGPGARKKVKHNIVKLKKKIDKLIGLRLEGWLAKRYLFSGEPADRSSARLINLVATLRKLS